MASGDLTLKPITLQQNEGLTPPAKAERLVISEGDSQFAGDNDNQITIVDEGGSIFEFRTLEKFPFLDPIPLPPAPSDSDNFNIITAGFEAYVSDYTLASDKDTADGSITVGVRNDGGQDSSKYEYAIKTPGSLFFGAWQSSATFNNLFASQYVVAVRSGVRTSESDFTLKHKEDADFKDSVYGEKYNFEFDDSRQNPSNTQQYRVRIYLRNYSGSVTTVQGTGTPAVYSLRGEGNDVYQNTILPSQLDINLYCTSLQYVEFARANDKDYQVVLELWNGSSYDEIWRGYILPRSYTEEFGNDPHTCGFQASDMLADLSNREYLSVDDDLNNGLTFYGGDRSALQIIRFCMEQLGIALPFRVALDTFEDSQDSTSSDTPLEQTYVDTDCYFSDLEIGQTTKRFISGRVDENLLFVDDIGESMNMADVIRALLRPFKCQLFQWGGYYYIVDSRKWLNSSSISYVEFDNTGTQTGTGSFSHILDFKRPTESTRFRWQGGLQSLTTTETYGIINLVYKTKERPSLLPTLTSNNIVGLGRALRNTTWVPSQNIGRRFTDEDGRTLSVSTDYKKEKVFYEFTQYSNKAGDSYIEQGIALDHGAGDVIELNYKFVINARYADNEISNETNTVFEGTTGPYQIFEYQIVKIAANSNKLSYYNEGLDAFVDTLTINQKFVEGLGSDQDIIIRASLNEKSTEGDRYLFRTFIPTIYNADFEGTGNDSGDAIGNGENTLKAIDTTNLPYGARQIGRFVVDGAESRPIYKAYELQQNPDGASVTPDDYNASTNPKRWRVIADWVLGNFGFTSAPPIYTVTTFKEIKAQLLPDGKKITDPIIQSRTINKDNTLQLNYDLFHYDAPNGVASKNVLFNSFFDANDNVTSAWTEDGDTKTLNEHLLDWLERLAIQARFKISGNIIHDVAFSPLKVLRDPDDDNRIFLPHGTKIDFVNASVQGEFIEIGADTIPGVSDWLAGDWDPDDFKTN